MRWVILFVLLLALASSVAAQQDFEDFDEADARAAGMRFIVETAAGDYVTVSLEDLLAGLVTFPDRHVRYVFQYAWPGQVPTMVSATQVQAGTAGAPGSKAIQFPAPPPSVQTVVVGFAQPVSAPDVEFAAIGETNNGVSSLALYTKLAAAVPLMVGGEAIDYSVWVNRLAFYPITAAEYMFLDRDASP